MIRKVLSGNFKGSFAIGTNILVNTSTDIGGCFAGPNALTGLELSAPIPLALLINETRKEIRDYVQAALQNGETE